MQIASTVDTKEKNEIFVETITSTTAGVILGYAVGLFLISNPVFWGTALILAIGSTALSHGLGKGARIAYDTFGDVDFVVGIGIDKTIFPQTTKADYQWLNTNTISSKIFQLKNCS